MDGSPSGSKALKALSISKCFLHRWPAGSLHCCNHASFFNALRMRRIATERAGCRTIAAVAAFAEHSIVCQYAAGRPDEQDQKQLRELAWRILKNVFRKFRRTQDTRKPPLQNERRRDHTKNYKRSYRMQGMRPAMPRADDRSKTSSQYR